MELEVVRWGEMSQVRTEDDQGLDGQNLPDHLFVYPSSSYLKYKMAAFVLT